MRIFVLEQIDAIIGKQRFDKLIVEEDGFRKCPFDEFENEQKQFFPNEIVQLYAYMNQVANLNALPEEKFHPYDNGDPREYEFKTKHLRLYCIEQRGGKIVVYGGTKAKQRNDTSDFRALKDKYIRYQQDKK